MPAGRPPADHYQLLGIAPLESDRAVISRQADALIAKVCGIRPGRHVAQWEQLLDALCAAKACLLDPAAKAAYDARLRGASATPQAPQSPFAQDGAAALQRPAGRAVDRPAPVRSDLSAERAFLLRLGCRMLAVTVLTAAGFSAALLLYDRFAPVQPEPLDQAASTQSLHPPATPDPHSERPRAETPPAGQVVSAGQPTALSGPAAFSREAPLAPMKPEVLFGPPGQQQFLETPGPGSETTQTNQEAAAGQGPLGTEAPQPEAPAKPAQIPLPEPQADPRKQAAFRRAISMARLAIGKRDFAGAKGHLRSAAESIQAPAEEAELGRLESLVANLEEFWKGMRKIVADLAPTQEIMLGQTPVLVVEADARHLTIRSEGRTRTYRIEEIPRPIIEALAEGGFAKHPSSKILLGSYMAMDPNGDHQQARRLWQEAAQQGEDVSELMPEVDPAASGAATGGCKLPLPTDQARLREAEKAVRTRFGADYAPATIAADKSALAQKLLEAAAAEDDPEARFVMLRQARDQAAAAGNPQLCCEAIDWLAAFYQADALGLKTAALEEVAKAGRSPSTHRELAQLALQLAQQAVLAGRQDEANRLAQLALASAQRSRSTALLRAVRTSVEQLRVGQQ